MIYQVHFGKMKGSILIFLPATFILITTAVFILCETQSRVSAFIDFSQSKEEVNTRREENIIRKEQGEQDRKTK